MIGDAHRLDGRRLATGRSARPVDLGGSTGSRLRRTLHHRLFVPVLLVVLGAAGVLVGFGLPSGGLAVAAVGVMSAGWVWAWWIYVGLRHPDS